MTGEGRSRLRQMALPLLLVLVTAAVFSSVGTFEFVNYDDPEYVTRNPVVKEGLTARGAAWAFTTVTAYNWHPLTWLSHMLDVELFGLAPGGHHLSNLVLHSAAAFCLLLFLLRATGRVWPAAVTAFLFALHPLHVESVAWVAERKDVLSTFFWFLLLLLYEGYARRPGRGRYLLMLLVFTAGLLSKPMLVTAPLTLLLLDYWPLGGETAPGGRPRRLLFEKLPFFALSALSAAVTYAVQARTGAMRTFETVALPERLANAAVSGVAYLGKAIRPVELSVFYPHPGHTPWPKAAAAAAALLLLTALAAVFRKRRPWIAVGWCWFLVTLAPVSGIIQVGGQAMADRYSYVPLLGIFIALAWEADGALSRRGRAARWAAAAFPLLALAALTRGQLAVWHDSGTLFSHAVEVTGGNYLAHNNLGSWLAGQGRYEEARRHYREAVGIRPDFAKAQYNLGTRLLDDGDLDGAARHLGRALELSPRMADALVNMALVSERRGEPAPALERYREALLVDPRLVRAHSNLGALLERLGRPEEAGRHFREALRLDPDDADGLYNYATSLLRRGRYGEAETFYRRLLARRPEHSWALVNLGGILVRSGRPGEAIAIFETALRLDPELKEAADGLARARRRAGREKRPAEKPQTP